MDMAPGYLSRGYAFSFAGLGSPVSLPAAEGWLLRRPIPNTPLHDAMGLYPLFCCRHWDKLGGDLDPLGNDLVSLVLVTDPLAEVSPAFLRTCFDQVRPYKDHFVVEGGRPPEDFVTKSHRLHATRALRKVNVEICSQPQNYLDDWMRLYSILANRHAITGIRRFSRQAFEQQISVPGTIMFRASVGDRTVGLDLWYVQEDVAQGHVAAFDEVGYELRASYATKWRMLEHFSDRVRWINLGAGTSMDADDGLSHFKRGFSTGTRTAWICGRVFQPAHYTALASQHAPTPTAADADGRYFPAYREGEFG